MGAEYNITIDKGATWIRTITWKNGGVPVVITGYDAVLLIKPSPSSDETILQIDNDTTANGTIVITGTSGKLEITIKAAATTLLGFDLAYYDLKLTSTGGVVTKLLRGRVSLYE